MVEHTLNSSSLKAKAGRLQVQGWLELHSETLAFQEKQVNKHSHIQLS